MDVILDILYIVTTDFYYPAFKGILIASVVAPFILKIWTSFTADNFGGRRKACLFLTSILNHVHAVDFYNPVDKYYFFAREHIRVAILENLVQLVIQTLNSILLG